MTDETRSYNEIAIENEQLRETINELQLKLSQQRLLNSEANAKIAFVEATTLTAPPTRMARVENEEGG